jgi:diguanylate cyclase (GGDEF)-like protein/PAS domain S-box-containing protein
MKDHRKNLSIKATIIMVFIIVMMVSALSIGSIIFVSWFNSSEETIKIIATTIADNLYDRIFSFMQVPIQLNEANHKIIEHGILDLSNEPLRDCFFVGVLNSNDSEIYSFSYGTANGEYYGARKNELGVTEIMRNNAATNGESWYYSVNENLTAGEITLKLGKFDPRTRAWYTTVEQSRQPSFSPVYKHFVMEDLTISAAWPVIDKNGSLQGVLGTHMLLSDIGIYLEDAVRDYNGYALIIEKETGFLIANSMNAHNFSVLQNGTLLRNQIDEIQNPFLKSTLERYRVHEDPHFTMKFDHERAYISVREIQMNGIDWVLLMAIPGAPFLSHVINSIYLTVVLVLIALGISFLIYHSVARRLMKPIDSLLEVTGAISSGDLTKRARVVRNDEIGSITESINIVADNMQSLINNLENKVEGRTKELQKANFDLEESKNRLKLLLDSTAEGIYGIDLNGDCTFCNASTVSILVYQSQEELLGKNMHTLIHHSYANRSPFLTEDCKILKSIKEGKGYKADDEVFWRADGTSFYVAYHSYPQIKNGQVIGGVITFMDITGRKQKEEQIEYLRCHDILTGIHNRSCYEENVIDIDVPANLPLSVIFADINGLKMTNDIFGHAAGDELVKRSAKILKQICRKTDILARIGGDEFIVLLPKTDEQEAKKMMSEIKNKFINERVEAIKCSISLGMATKVVADKPIQEVTADAENEMYKDKTTNRKFVNDDIINTLLESLHLESPREKQHSVFVKFFCEKLGTALNLPEMEISKLQRAAYIHDIGKITLDKDLLIKKILSAEEYEIMKQHPVIGYRLLNLFDNTLDLAEYVYGHHERWDGSGYPRGLKNEQIPLLSRILSIAEAYERVLNRGEQAISERKKNAAMELKSGAGTQFDPEIVSVFIKLVENMDIEEAMHR